MRFFVSMDGENFAGMVNRLEHIAEDKGGIDPVLNERIKKRIEFITPTEEKDYLANKKKYETLLREYPILEND